MPDLRPGEFLLTECAGGKCAVCRQLIAPGPAVQLSKFCARIRHVDCLPKTDSRGEADGRLDRLDGRSVRRRGAYRP